MLSRGKMMMLLTLTLAGVLAGCHGYSHGAPTKACESMFPTGHKVAAQNSPAPYTISVGATNYTSGEKVTITLSAKNTNTDYFEGFFIQARKTGSNEPIGTFTLPANDNDIKTIKFPMGKYDKNAVTHTSDIEKTSKTFTWTSNEREDVNFYVTAVKEKETFWTNIVSVKLSGDNSGPSSASGLAGNVFMLSAVTSLAFIFRSL